MPSPQEHARLVRANRNLTVEGRVTGEGWCWHAAYSADDFVDGYVATKDREWLVEGQVYFDWLVSLLETGPDGYRGWIGPYEYDNAVWCDVHVGDAILVNPMLRFAETVLADSALKKEFGPAADVYIALARRDFIEKWDARGTWKEDGPYGAYVAWNRYLAPGDLSEWRLHDEIKNSTLSLPYNKQFDVAVACLKLYRLTGEPFYRERAERVFRRFKSRIQLVGAQEVGTRRVDDHYVWNYWEPAGSWDFNERNEMRHWVNVHPYRNYQAGEVANIVEAYHAGIVFDEQDMRRIVATNLGVMWNGDSEAPKWRNSNARGPWEPPPPPPKGWSGRAGTLWTALADFDPTVRGLQSRSLRKESLSEAHFLAGVASRPPGYERLHAGTSPPTVFDPPITPCGDLHMAAVMPTRIRAGAPVLIAAKATASGNLDVSLYSADGSRQIESIARRLVDAGQGGNDTAVIQWNGLDAQGRPVYEGDYLVRFRLADGWRDVAVTIAR